MRRFTHAFTLVEMLVAMGIFGTVTVGLVAFGSTSIRLIARNLATNHSHETMRVSDLALLSDLHDAASPFRLIDFDGTNYTDATPTITTDKDAQTQQFASTRANGVRYRMQAGGPYRFAADTKAKDTKLKFDFGVGGKVPYVPQAGDKLVIPLVAREFDIIAVLKSPTTGNTEGTVVISDSDGIGFTLDATTAGNITTANFYREVAYTVYGGQLRYHANYTGASKSTFTVVRDKITSPKPFALLFPSSTATSSDGMNLRISLEFYDTSYSARRFTSGAVTLQATVPPRWRPTPVASTNAS
jgi:prepilin-type N-terminal cleavage/methylation domain-containing protein